MTTTFNRNQILRLTRETIDNTLRFFHTVNENLFTLVNRLPHAEVRPMNLDEITRICNDFQRNHETRISRLTTIWNELHPHLHQQVPTTNQHLFNTDDIIRINREMIDHTMRFFTTTNEALLHGRLPETPEVMPRTVIETITNAVQNFQRTQNEVFHAFEQTFNKVINTITPVTTHTTNTENRVHNTPINVVRDEIFTLNRDIIENTIRFFMTLNEHVVAIIENHDQKNVTQHTDQINQIHRNWLNTHHTIIDRLNTCIRRTAESLSVTPEHLTRVTSLTPLFDHHELLRINQDAIASTVKFFHTVTENLLTHPDHTNLVHATEDFQKTQRILTTRIETIWTESVKHLLNNLTRTTETRTMENTGVHHHETHTTETRTHHVNQPTHAGTHQNPIHGTTTTTVNETRVNTNNTIPVEPTTRTNETTDNTTNNTTKTTTRKTTKSKHTNKR